MEYYRRCRQEKHCLTLRGVPSAPGWALIGGVMIVSEAGYCADCACGIHTFQIHFTELNAGLELTSASPKPGELGNFCPACPQVGIHLPEDWTADPNRWVYRRVLTADGNFKADHVRQKPAADDIWLSDGLGMTTRNSEYKLFLQTAQERQTVSAINNRESFGLSSISSHRRHHVKILSALLKMPCSIPKHATLQE